MQADYDRSRGYVDERLAVMRYRRTLERSGGEAARDFLYSKLEYSSMRELAIRTALEQNNPEEAIRLAEAGEAMDEARTLPGLATRWKKFRFDAYSRTGQVESLRALGTAKYPRRPAMREELEKLDVRL